MAASVGKFRRERAGREAGAPLQCRARRSLEALSFFMADMQAGTGPFLGVFLLSHGWSRGLIGSVMTAGGIAGMLMTAPAGAWIDSTKHKRLIIVLTGVCTILASLLTLYSQKFWVVTASLVGTAVAGSAIVPAVAGITLGIFRQKGFNSQNGRNQAFNHAGNMIGAALSGFIGWHCGLPAVFWLAAGFGLCAIVSAARIPEELIDHDAARGLEHEDGIKADDEQVKGLTVLLQNKPLLILAAALCLYHLGNAVMLLLYGMAVVEAKEGDPAGFTAMTVVVAQGVMIFASIIAMRMASSRGYWLVLLISFIALPVRGLIASSLISGVGVWPVQALDGLGAGLQSVAVPGLVAHLLKGTGRVNVGQGSVQTVQNIGAALSPILGGWIAQELGYRTAFVILGFFALPSIALWLFFGGMLRQACDRKI